MKLNIFWFRRDLRIDDNTGLNEALFSGVPVLPVFIFDTNITDDLPYGDRRISFIYESLTEVNRELLKHQSSLSVFRGDPVAIFEMITGIHEVGTVFVNDDYEPYSMSRDSSVAAMLKKKGIEFRDFKDQVIFAKKEISKSDGSPYTMFTAYRNAWIKKLKESPEGLNFKPAVSDNYVKINSRFPSPKELGFATSPSGIKDYEPDNISGYGKFRDIPSEDRTTYLGPHLRFGTISIRKVINIGIKTDEAFLDELIWREFFKQILFNFPNVVSENFKKKYNNLSWRNNEVEFLRWCKGETGIPVVDAGMRQLNETGYMHNRIRMITAGFLCKQLLTDWRWGEAFFAEKLNDYELSSNNGNWQWAAGTGCDAAPYFRIFNPSSQQKKFDPEGKYVKKWVEDIDKDSYPDPIVDHSYARERAISAFKASLM